MHDILETLTGAREAHRAAVAAFHAAVGSRVERRGRWSHVLASLAELETQVHHYMRLWLGFRRPGEEPDAWPLERVLQRAEEDCLIPAAAPWREIRRGRALWHRPLTAERQAAVLRGSALLQAELVPLLAALRDPVRGLWASVGFGPSLLPPLEVLVPVGRFTGKGRPCLRITGVWDGRHNQREFSQDRPGVMFLAGEDEVELQVEPEPGFNVGSGPGATRRIRISPPRLVYVDTRAASIDPTAQLMRALGGRMIWSSPEPADDEALSTDLSS